MVNAPIDEVKIPFKVLEAARSHFAGSAWYHLSASRTGSKADLRFETPDELAEAMWRGGFDSAARM